MQLPQQRSRGHRVPAQSWSNIEDFYSRLAAEAGFGAEMAELIRHIRSCGYASRLFAYTSMHELIIGLYPELEPSIETLHIEYDKDAKAYQLRYYAAPSRHPEVERIYPKEVGLKKFDDFIGYLKW